jgi:hypothetical protein
MKDHDLSTLARRAFGEYFLAFQSQIYNSPSNESSGTRINYFFQQSQPRVTGQQHIFSTLLPLSAAYRLTS